MALSSFRFLHAADFRLDTPCFGVPHLPPELRGPFVDARYAAARRVFDTAIDREVDFVVLAGGLLDSRLPGLRGPLFLIEQFERLAAQGIDVYWAGATFETHGRWPSHVDLPSNLKLFTSDHPTHVQHQSGSPIARLMAVDSRHVRAVDTGLFTISIHPRFTAAISTTAINGVDTPVDYWALGGQSHRDTQTRNGDVVHFPGSPQGRKPSEQGPHGCSLVVVETDGDVVIQPVATDVVRWCHEELTLGLQTSWAEVEQHFDERLHRLHDELTSDSSVEMAVVNWTVSGSGLSLQRLVQPRHQELLLSEFNKRQQRQAPALWSLGMETSVDAHQLSDWQQEQSSLGAFLRELGQMSDSLCAAHAPKTSPAAFNNQLRRQVVNEGIHRLGTKPQLTTDN